VSPVRARLAVSAPPRVDIDADLAPVSIAARCWRGDRSLTSE